MAQKVKRITKNSAGTGVGRDYVKKKQKQETLKGIAKAGVRVATGGWSAIAEDAVKKSRAKKKK